MIKNVFLHTMYVYSGSMSYKALHNFKCMIHAIFGMPIFKNENAIERKWCLSFELKENAAFIMFKIIYFNLIYIIRSMWPITGTFTIFLYYVIKIYQIFNRTLLIISKYIRTFNSSQLNISLSNSIEQNIT